MPTWARHLLNSTDLGIRVREPTTKAHLTFSELLERHAEASLGKIWPVLQIRETVSKAALISSLATASLEEAADLSLPKCTVTGLVCARHPKIRTNRPGLESCEL